MADILIVFCLYSTELNEVSKANLKFKQKNIKISTNLAKGLDLLRFVVGILPHYRSCDGTPGSNLL